jgi:hypothetical protein
VSAGERTRRGGATARLDLSGRDCDRANQSENPKDPRIAVHPSNVTPSNLPATLLRIFFLRLLFSVFRSPSSALLGSRSLGEGGCPPLPDFLRIMSHVSQIPTRLLFAARHSFNEGGTSDIFFRIPVPSALPIGKSFGCRLVSCEMLNV